MPFPANPADSVIEKIFTRRLRPCKKTNTTAGFNTDAWQEIRFDIAVRLISSERSSTCQPADKSVDAIFSSHNIEHVYPHEVAQVLNEFLRVLSDDGFVVLTCPDLQAVCEFVAADKLLEPIYESPVGPISPLDVFVWSSLGNRGRQPLYGPQMWIHLFSVDQTFPQQRI